MINCVVEKNCLSCEYRCPLNFLGIVESSRCVLHPQKWRTPFKGYSAAGYGRVEQAVQNLGLAGLKPCATLFRIRQDIKQLLDNKRFFSDIARGFSPVFLACCRRQGGWTACLALFVMRIKGVDRVLDNPSVS